MKSVATNFVFASDQIDRGRRSRRERLDQKKGDIDAVVVGVGRERDFNRTADIEGGVEVVLIVYRPGDRQLAELAGAILEVADIEDPREGTRHLCAVIENDVVERIVRYIGVGVACH